MDRRGIAALCVAFVMLAGVTQLSGQRPKVTDACLVCICEAITNCTLNCAGDVCLFRITWGYWADAGKPVLDGDSPEDEKAYARCVSDPYCAGKAVNGYMDKFAQDCDGNGVVDCQDYFRLHLLGGYGCGGSLPPKYSEKFNTCLNQVQILLGES